MPDARIIIIIYCHNYFIIKYLWASLLILYSFFPVKLTMLDQSYKSCKNNLPHYVSLKIRFERNN